MVTDKMLQNANKIAYLIEQYPEHTLNDIIGLLEMPAIDMNTAIWVAVDLKFITEPDEETNKCTVLEKPEEWVFGDAVNDLQDTILYSLARLAKKETDLEEFYFGQWTKGYPAHDVLVTMKQLVQNRQVAEYDLTDPKDPENVYTFYTLYENGEQLWGRKQFKEQPKLPKKEK